MKVHQIKIDFHVTKEIKRYVYVYIVEAKYLYLIDSGVYGCERQILDYIASIGRKEKEIKGIFVTHAHPDHIGSLSYFKEATNCSIYASEKEKGWIEDIDLQFRERPIPNFYTLAGKSTKIDHIVKDGDKIQLEEDLVVEVFKTAGHSIEEVSYKIGRSFFIGDSLPVKGDIPIFIDERETRNTIELLENFANIDFYYPAWDRTYDSICIKEKIQEARDLMDQLKKFVNEVEEESNLVEEVCEKMKMPMLKNNPLFKRTLQSLRNKPCYFMVDTYIEKESKEYEEYIDLVKPIVESYGGKYLVRSNTVTSLSSKRNPQRVILIRFPSKEALHACFKSEEYKRIQQKREENVEAHALIVESN